MGLIHRIWRAMSGLNSNTVNFGFLNRNIRNQIMHSRSIVEQAEKLKVAASNAPDDIQRANLEAIAQNLLAIADNLAANAEVTITTSASTISKLST